MVYFSASCFSGFGGDAGGGGDDDDDDEKGEDFYTVYGNLFREIER